MQRFASYALAFLFLFAAVATQAQTVRFTTSVGAFDMVLNPTGDANLQPLVDNMLANVAAGVYHDTIINRAAENFVLQLGGFTTQLENIADVPFEGFTPANNFESVVVDEDGNGEVDFDALSNTRGTVSLALSGQPNTGSSAFFVNATDNSFLDSQGFVPFAEISDMTVVDALLTGEKDDITNRVQGGFTAGPNGPQPNPNFTDVPITEGGGLIIIESAGVISSEPFSYVDPLLSAVSTIEETAAATSQTDSEASINALTIEDDIPLSPTTDFGFFENSQASAVNSIPEPSSIALFLLAAAGLRRRRAGVA